MSETTHQGWKSYETWCVNLWLSNEEGLYNDVRERAEELAEEHHGDLEEASRPLSDWIKEYVGNMAPDVSGLWSDLLTAALDSVDWHEIADSWLEEFDGMFMDEQEEQENEDKATAEE